MVLCYTNHSDLVVDHQHYPDDSILICVLKGDERKKIANIFTAPMPCLWKSEMVVGLVEV